MKSAHTKKAKNTSRPHGRRLPSPRAMMRPRWMGLILVLVGLTTGGLSTSAPDASASSHCDRTVKVTFVSYTGMDQPRTNGCWKYDKLPVFDGAELRHWNQSSDWLHAGKWHICHWKKGSDGPDKAHYWAYDDTNPTSGDSDRTRLNEARAIAKCARAGIPENRRVQGPFGPRFVLEPPVGYVFMAPKKGDCGKHHHCWRKPNPGGKAHRFYAELYTGDEHAMNKFGEWRAERRKSGAPLINIGVGDLRRGGDVERNVFTICRAVRSRGWISVYSPVSEEEPAKHKPITHDNGRLTAVERGLNRCTAG